MSICVEEERREVFAAFVWRFVVDNKQLHSLDARSQTSCKWGSPPQKLWSRSYIPSYDKGTIRTSSVLLSGEWSCWSSLTLFKLLNLCGQYTNLVLSEISLTVETNRKNQFQMIYGNFVNFADQHTLTVSKCKSFIVQCNWFEMNINGLKAEPFGLFCHGSWQFLWLKNSELWFQNLVSTEIKFVVACWWAQKLREIAKPNFCQIWGWGSFIPWFVLF